MDGNIFLCTANCSVDDHKKLSINGIRVSTEANNMICFCSTLISSCLSQEGIGTFDFFGVHEIFVSHLLDFMSTKYPKGLPVSKVKIYGTEPVPILVKSHECGI